MADQARFDSFAVDMESGQVRKGAAHQFRLPCQLKDALALFLRNPGKVIKTEDLRQHLWTDSIVEEGAPNRVMKKLRDAFGPEGTRLFETIPKAGYVFRAHVFWSHSGERTILVLPFRYDGSPNYGYLGDALTRSLINSLGRMSKLAVRSDTTSMRYKDSGRSISEVAKETDSQFIIEGSVSVLDQQVSIRLQLVDSYHDKILLSDCYEKHLDDISAIHNSISEKTARSVGVRISKMDAERLVKSKKINPLAYRHYLEGREHWAKASPVELRAAIECFKKALAVDIEFALAYAGLADAYNLEALAGSLHPKVASEHAREAAEKAIEIDDSMAECHTPMAAILAYFDWDWLRAEEHAKRAIDLNPGYETAHHVYAMTCLMPQGRFDEALEQIQFAESRNPLSSFIATCVGIVQFHSRRYEEAIISFDRALQLSEDKHFLTYLHRGWSNQQLKRFDMALNDLKLCVELSRHASVALGAYGNCLAQSGNADAAAEILMEIGRKSETEYVSGFDRALLYVGLGDTKQALLSLQTAFQDRSPSMTRLAIHPLLDPLRSTHEFNELLRGVNLAVPLRS